MSEEKKLAAVPQNEIVAVQKEYNALTEPEKAAFAESIEQRLLGDKTNIERGFLLIGRNLLIFERLSLFRKRGYETFFSWVSSPEVNLTPSMASVLKKVYELHIKFRIPAEDMLQAGANKLYMISKFAHPDNVDDLVKAAGALSVSDLKIHLKELEIQKKGSTKKQVEKRIEAEAKNIVRQACPIGCGDKCQYLNGKEALSPKVVHGKFMRFLGSWNWLKKKINSIHATIEASASVPEKPEPKPAAEPAVPVPVNGEVEFVE